MSDYRTALTAYEAHMATIAAQLERLNLILELHNQPSTVITWAHVGDVTSIESRLAEILEGFASM